MTYATPMGGFPTQDTLLTGKAIFTNAYAVIPAGVMRDIVISYLPYWNKTRAWILARPLTGFAETFSQYIVEIQPKGGSTKPEPGAGVEAVIFVTSGSISLSYHGETHLLTPGGYAYCPPDMHYEILNSGDIKATIHLIRKKYQTIDGVPAPKAFTTNEQKVAESMMPNSNDAWSTTRFVDPEDISHDMHVNIVNFKPGGVIPFEETHVMEHGIFILKGKADYLLNTDWVSVEEGDYLWLRAFCPQACKNTGTGDFRYLLYKDVNRHASL